MDTQFTEKKKRAHPRKTRSDLANSQDAGNPGGVQQRHGHGTGTARRRKVPREMQRWKKKGLMRDTILPPSPGMAKAPE